MNTFILTILVVGLSGIVAQVLLLRELLVSFYGNELTIGIILANWIIAEATGVFIIGKFIDRIKNKINIFFILQLIFSVTLPFSIYFARTFKSILGIPFGEAIGLNIIFLVSFFIILTVGFCHGALFSTLCNIYAFIKESKVSIGKVYTWETIGTICGGIIFTFLFIPHLNSFQIAFLISFFNLIICLFFFRRVTKIFRYILLLLIFLIGYFSLNGGINYIHRLSIDKLWNNQQVLENRNSVYGNITVTKQLEQYTFFYNGIPTITTPYPDKQFVEDFGHLPLLFHHAPKDILIISAGAGGLINELLKHPIKNLDYAELDPLIIDMLKKYPTKLTESELRDRRVNVINLDGRFFIRTAHHKYDIVLIGISNPSDLSTNRLFTQEFFSLIRGRLNQDGIFAFWLPGSLTYISSELRDLNACILNALRNTYEYIRIIPGDYNIFLASNSEGIMKVTPSLISQKIIQENIDTSILVPNYLDYRLNKNSLEWFMQTASSATKKINRDLKPIAVFEMLILWNKKFSKSLYLFLKVLNNLDSGVVFLFIFLIMLLLSYVFYRARDKFSTITYCIATTGFFGMLTSLILVFSFQVFYGYLYRMIGILISIFMAGIALGSIYITSNFEKIKSEFRLFVRLEALIIAFTFILALTITRFLSSGYYASLIFIVLFFISGLLMGLEFPLASKIYLGVRKQVGSTAGILYAADLLGGWVAGISGSIVLLPVLGFFNTCLVIVMFKLSSLLLLILYGVPEKRV